MTDPNIYCKECAGLMIPYENNAYNSTYRVKIDSWRCSNCSRVVEEKRLDKAFVWK